MPIAKKKEKPVGKNPGEGCNYMGIARYQGTGRLFGGGCDYSG